MSADLLDTFIKEELYAMDHQPQLVIIEQNSLAQEKFAKNGIQKNVHVVVKNTPFNISVGFATSVGAPALDFNVVTVEALLMYDCEGDRFVDFVNNKPLEYKGAISDSGDRINLEIRLKKLSSHLEDMFFKIRIRGVDTHTGEAISSLEITSQPIKVVSKPEQVARILRKQSGEKAEPKKPRTKKRSLNDMMFESMQNIEKQQQEQKDLLAQLLEKQGASVSAGSTLPVKKKGSSLDLETAITNLIQAFEHTDAAERPLKIRKLMNGSSTASVSTLLEFSSQIQNQVNAQSIVAPFSMPNPGEFQTQSNVADVADLSNIEDFYRDLLMPSSSSYL